ncbi:phosphoribosylformylglycinamidine cyclo-ligase [Bacillus sp. H-16]|uniref:phosphoribosylformylglycinamidine cyclo-ligase n=1 Tax=Alteribacter salitolerans TaxID=2912333 RepID=UPI001962F5F0|nr:phosphoribosylformylglycinamidine cyclo-ligase [Alteribacter salitolerans]MBM7094919.1 phosphoribosylformylglycinamidine cyclo-ligase [Alteribacter salitolerans]
MSKAYKQAGVNIEAGYESVNRMKSHVTRTRRPEVMGGLGGFGGMFDLSQKGYKEPVLVSGTDGVGTKLMVAQETGIHDTIGIDAVAMCVNDIVVQGAEPLFFLDYLALGENKPDVVEKIIKGIADGCAEAGCALIGGETAEMPGMYETDEYDVAGFVVGAAEKSALIDGSAIQEGDVLIGLPSSGLHSNGFSLVRKVIADRGIRYSDPMPDDEGGRTVGEWILTPTKIYVKPVLSLVKQGLLKGAAHNTGGGLYENVPRMLPEGVKAVVDSSAWRKPSIFTWMGTLGGIVQRDMYETFNMGIGMVLAVSENQVVEAMSLLKEAGEEPVQIGKIERAGAGEAPVIIEGVCL